MKTIIFSNELKKIKRILKNPDGSLKYFIIQDDPERELIAFLRKNDCKEISSPDILKKRSRDFQKEYAEFIAGLNNDNHHAMAWWALNLTGKSTLSTSLCKQIFYFLIIVEVVNKELNGSLLVVSGDIDLAHQTYLWLKNSDTNVINAITRSRCITDLIMEISPGAVIYAFLRTLLYKFYAGHYLCFKPSRAAKYVVVKTLISNQSFTKNGEYRDAYFGRFIEYLKKRNLACVVFATVFRPYMDNLKKIKALAESKSIAIIPLEYCVSFFYIFKCLFAALLIYFVPLRLKREATIEELNVTYLVKKAIRGDCISPRFFVNFLMYYSTVSLLKRIAVDTFYYPFENRSWEKMILFALRKYSPVTKIVGYQHTPFTQKHTELCLGSKERQILPLPDKIITGGEITKEMLEKLGNFPSEIVQIGCALRQDPEAAVTPRLRNGKNIHNVLVILSSSKEDYFKTLLFVKEAFFKKCSYAIHIRPHPEIAFDKVLLQMLQADSLFQVVENPLTSELYWSDVVIYSSPTTVALHAISLGIPVIYIEINKFLDSDTLFDLGNLKWRVDEPDKLSDTIMAIDRIPEEEFKQLQKKAVEYVRRYLWPVTEDNLKAFFSI